MVGDGAEVVGAGVGADGVGVAGAGVGAVVGAVALGGAAVVSREGTLGGVCGLLSPGFALGAPVALVFGSDLCGSRSVLKPGLTEDVDLLAGGDAGAAGRPAGPEFDGRDDDPGLGVFLVCACDDDVEGFGFGLTSAAVASDAGPTRETIRIIAAIVRRPRGAAAREVVAF